MKKYILKHIYYFLSYSYLFFIFYAFAGSELLRHKMEQSDVVFVYIFFFILWAFYAYANTPENDEMTKEQLTEEYHAILERIEENKNKKQRKKK